MKKYLAALLIVLFLSLSANAKPKPNHFYKDEKWWIGTAIIVGTAALDAQSSCRAFSEGYVESQFLIRGTRSCGVVTAAALGGAAFMVAGHALLWHCVQNDGRHCYGLNQDNGKYKNFWDTVAYTALPATSIIAHVPAAIHNYELPAAVKNGLVLQ